MKSWQKKAMSDLPKQNVKCDESATENENIENTGEKKAKHKKMKNKNETKESRNNISK